METEAIDIFWNIRNAVLCLGFLIGIGTGIFLVVRKQKMAGFLAMAGFFLFSLEPIADFIIYRVIYKIYRGIYIQEFNADKYLTLDYAYLCISAPAFFFGSIILVVAIINMMKSSRNFSSSQSEIISNGKME